RSPWVLAGLMTLAMGMPMMVFYAIGVLGPQIIQDLGISREQLGWLTTSTFGLAALLSPWAGALVQRMGNRHGLFLLFLLVAMSFSLIAVLPGFWGVLTALLLCGLAQSLANPVTNQAIAQ
ncbi:MFS transporter, partial [Alcaligenes pakistanensis]